MFFAYFSTFFRRPEGLDIGLSLFRKQTDEFGCVLPDVDTGVLVIEPVGVGSEKFEFNGDDCGVLPSDMPLLMSQTNQKTKPCLQHESDFVNKTTYFAIKLRALLRFLIRCYA